MPPRENIKWHLGDLRIFQAEHFGHCLHPFLTDQDHTIKHTSLINRSVLSFNAAIQSLKSSYDLVHRNHVLSLETTRSAKGKPLTGLLETANTLISNKLIVPGRIEKVNLKICGNNSAKAS